jgi:hypothetical protein
MTWILSFRIEDWDGVCTFIVVSADGDDDIGGVNISAIHLLERLTILVR